MGMQAGRGEHPPGMPALGSWLLETEEKAQFSRPTGKRSRALQVLP